MRDFLLQIESSGIQFARKMVKNVQYSISVYSENKNDMKLQKKLTERSTGTTVIIGNVDQILPEQVTIFSVGGYTIKRIACTFILIRKEMLKYWSTVNA